MAVTTVRLELSALRALAIGLACVALACSTPTTVDTVGEALERLGRHLESQQGVEGELEVLYEPDGDWVLLVVPRTGLDERALASAGLSESATARLAEASAGWSGSQYLVQVRSNAIVIRTLDPAAIDVGQQFAVSGRGAVWLTVIVKKEGASDPARLVSFSASSVRSGD